MQGRDGTVAERLGRLAYELLRRVAEAEPFLRAWPSVAPPRPQCPRRLPVLAHLDEACSVATPATLSFVAALARDAAALDWNQTYTAADVEPAFLDLYGWTEFVGSRGPIPSERIACGVLMLGPEADYPLHAHEAEELYIPVAGTTLWRRGEDDFVARPPGTPIHHPAFVPHAMRTETEPLLALYLWRGGGLAAKARLLPPA